MGKGILTVSDELLKELLCLPEDTNILFVREGELGTFEVMAEHPDLPEGLVDCEPKFETTQPRKLISWGYEGEEVLAEEVDRIELLEYTVAELRKRLDHRFKYLEREIERIKLETVGGD